MKSEKLRRLSHYKKITNSKSVLERAFIFLKILQKGIDKVRIYIILYSISSCRIFVDANNAHVLGGAVPVEVD